MITFAIPTWNRVDKLERLLRNLTDEIYRDKKLTAKIHVCDNASDDGTVALLDRWSKNYPDLLTYTVEPEHVDWQRNFGDAFNGVTTQWTWQMGDDDGIAPNVLPAVYDLLNRGRHKFLHVAEKSRCSGTGGVYEGTFRSLSYDVGFVEFSGFLSGNVCDAQMLKEAYSPEMMDIYGKTGSYALCAHMYDRFCDEPAALVDIPAVVLQDAEQTHEAQVRWGSERVVIKYAWVVDAWDILVSRGKMTRPVPATFQRYMTSDLIGKIANAYQSHATCGDEITEEDWQRLHRMADYLEDGQQRHDFLTEFRPLVDGTWQRVKEAREFNDKAEVVFQNGNFIMFPYKYIKD